MKGLGHINAIGPFWQGAHQLGLFERRSKTTKSIPIAFNRLRSESEYRINIPLISWLTFYPIAPYQNSPRYQISIYLIAAEGIVTLRAKALLSWKLNPHVSQTCVGANRRSINQMKDLQSVYNGRYLLLGAAAISLSPLSTYPLPLQQQPSGYY